MEKVDLNTAFAFIGVIIVGVLVQRELIDVTYAAAAFGLVAGRVSNKLPSIKVPRRTKVSE